MKDDVIFVTLIGGLFALFLFSMAVLGYAVDGTSCFARWQGTYPAQYGFFSGCRVQFNGKWMPEQSIRGFGDV